MMLTLALVALAQVPPTPVVVELYSSEGCSSCPPAEEAAAWLEANQPVGGAEVMILELHVDYWNHLGWADPFSDASFSKAQQLGDERFGWGVYTPQAVVDGRTAFVGSGARLVEAVEKQTRRAKPPLRVELARRGPLVHVVVEGVKAPRVEVSLVESGLVTDVLRGENRGRRLTHASVVRVRQVAGPCDGRAGRAICPLPSATTTRHASFELDPSWRVENLRVVAVAREGEAGPVITAGQRLLSSAREDR